MKTISLSVPSPRPVQHGQLGPLLPPSCCLSLMDRPRSKRRLAKEIATFAEETGKSCPVAVSTRLRRRRSVNIPYMNTETMVALIGAAGVLGTIGGTVVGARIQANGGHAQAQAARDAAATAAQAARGQALGERRWAVLTAYLRAADLCVDVVSQSYDAGFLTENDSAYKVFVLAQAEAELAAPTSMDTHLAEMHNAVRNVWSTADIWAPHGWGGGLWLRWHSPAGRRQSKPEPPCTVCEAKVLANHVRSRSSGPSTRSCAQRSKPSPVSELIRSVGCCATEATRIERGGNSVGASSTTSTCEKS